MSDDDTPDQTTTQSPGTSHRAGLWIAMIGLVAAVAGPLIPVLAAGSDNGSSSPPVQTPTSVISIQDTTEPPATDSSEPATEDPETTEPPSDVEVLTDQISTGQGSLTDCTESDYVPDEADVSVSCGSTDDTSPTYVYVHSFATTSDLDAWVVSEQNYYGAADGERCDAAGTWSGTWTNDDVEIGDLVCGWDDDEYYMSWTFPDELIAVEASDTDAALVYSWWYDVPLIF